LNNNDNQTRVKVGESALGGLSHRKRLSLLINGVRSIIMAGDR
jgi:hypothetical protein